jgi:predicted permease
MLTDNGDAGVSRVYSLRNEASGSSLAVPPCRNQTGRDRNHDERQAGEGNRRGRFVRARAPPGVPPREREPTLTDWTVWQDVRQAIRAWRSRHGLAAAVIAMLAVGIGATIAIFAVVKGVLIDPLPYPDSAALVRLGHTIGGIEQPYFNDAIATTYAANRQAFESLGVWTPDAPGVTITGQDEPEEVRALIASRGLLMTLGVQPALGRWFSDEEDAPGGAGTVILGHSYWQRRYGADRGVVGRTIVIDARPRQIIGVMPAFFAFGPRFDVLLPLRIDPARLDPGFRLNGVARMKPEITLDQANADIGRMLEMYFDAFRVNTRRSVKWVPSLVPLEQDVIGDVGPTLWVLMGSIAIVLVMACSNVANLLLVRAESRRQELAIRAALGAKWTRVARAMLAESMMLALAGGVLGLAMAYGAVRLLVDVDPVNLPRLSQISIDPTIALFACGVTLMCGLFFSAVPIARLFRERFTIAIGPGHRGSTLTRDSQRAQTVLVVAQIALALTLLVSSGLMLRSIQALRGVQPGFVQPRTLQAFTITLPSTVVPDLERVSRIQQRILDNIAARPGVASVAFTTRLPMDPGDRWSAALAIEDKPDDGRRAPPNRQVKVVSPGSFRTFGTPLIAGRDFTWTDADELREVAIVSENLAREVWGSAEAALGKRIRQFYGPKGAPWREIVGVVGDVYDDGVHQAPPATVYWPARLDATVFAGYQPRRVSVVIRTERAGSAALLEELRQAVWSVHPDLPLAQTTTLDLLYDRSMSRTSLTLGLLALAGVMALLLGIAGVYGVIAYAVAQRRREIGIRIALGAEARAIRGLFVRRGMIVVLAGLLLGSSAAAGFSQLMRSLLFGVEPLDEGTFTVMSVVLVGSTLLATYVPARRALRVDPVETMRGE